MDAVLARRRVRRAEVLNFTIVELLILFLFAAQAFFFLAREESLTQVTALEADLDRALQRIAMLEQELQKRDRLIEDLRMEISGLEEQIKDLERYIKRLEASVADRLSPEEREKLEKGKGALEEQLALLKFQLDQERQKAGEVERSLADKVAELERQLRKMHQSLENQREAARIYREKWTDTLEQLARLSKAQGKGLDHPRCVIAGAENIERVYTVTMYPSDFLVEAEWPPKLDSRFFSIPGFSEMGTHSRLTRSQFGSAGKKIYDWSTKQKPQCRFIVNVIDRTGNDKGAYVKQLKTVENVFYKRQR